MLGRDLTESNEQGVVGLKYALFATHLWDVWIESIIPLPQLVYKQAKIFAKLVNACSAHTQYLFNRFKGIQITAVYHQVPCRTCSDHSGSKGKAHTILHHVISRTSYVGADD
jgi:hypothetical protein